MPLVPCPGCGRQLNDRATTCYNCGRARETSPGERNAAWSHTPAVPAAPVAAAAVPFPSAGGPALAGAGAPYAPAMAPPYAGYPPVRAVATTVPFHPMPVALMVIMSVATFGIYNLYWFYRNWRRVNDTSDRGISPFWRAVFGLFFAYSLFDEVDAAARANRMAVDWSAGSQAVMFVVLSLCGRLPDPLWLLALANVVPLIPVQNTINALALARGEQPDTRTGPGTVALLLGGAILWMLVLIGFMVGPDVPQ